MRPITSSCLAMLATVSVLAATAAEARPAGGRQGIAVRPGGLSAAVSGGRSASFGRAGFGRHHGHAFGRGSRGLNFADGYGAFGYGAYGTAGYYGYGYGYDHGGYAGPMPGAGYLDGPYGPLVVPGYGGIPQSPVQPPAIYVIDTPSASAARRPGAAPSRLAVVSGQPERMGGRVIEVPPRTPRR